MNISWKINTDGTVGGEVDPDDLCGEITLEHKGFIIHDGLTYLENWFECFVNVIETASQCGKHEYDLVSEPDPLEFEFRRGEFDLSYRNQTLVGIKNSDFEKSVVKSGMELVALIRLKIPDGELLSLCRLERYLARRASD